MQQLGNHTRQLWVAVKTASLYMHTTKKEIIECCFILCISRILFVFMFVVFSMLYVLGM